MATITWREGNCRIVRLEPLDQYTDETGRERTIQARQYLLLVGAADLHFDYYNGEQDSVRITIPINTLPEDRPITLIGYKPDPDEWWDFICRKLEADFSTPARWEIDKALDQYEPDDEEESV